MKLLVSTATNTSLAGENDIWEVIFTIHPRSEANKRDIATKLSTHFTDNFFCKTNSSEGLVSL